MSEVAEKEEFEIPQSNISFDKAITSLHNLRESAFHTFMYRFVNSLSIKQVGNLKKYIEQIEEHKKS